MRRAIEICATACLLAGPAFAEASLAGEPPARDREAILAMAGTYTVDFNFRETVPLEPGYVLKEPYHASAAVELVEVLADEPGRIVLQHVLALEDRVVKHWRQDWLYENRDLYEFAGDGTWQHRRLTADEARGTWTQRVYQVDDSPRYQGFGAWTHVDGVSAWESNWTWRPLPRREYTKRDDYDVMIGRNRHTLSHTGWVHEQDNYKLVLRDGERHVLCRETGLNTYDHIDVAKADAARGYWSRTREFWKQVRSAWDGILVPGATVALQSEIDDKPLWKSMFELATEFGEGGLEAPRTRIESTLAGYLDDAPDAGSASLRAGAR